MLTRYYEDDNRRRAHDMAKEHGAVFTIEQIRDICYLVKAGQWPNGHYSDDECNLWGLLREYFGDF